MSVNGITNAKVSDQYNAGTNYKDKKTKDSSKADSSASVTAKQDDTAAVYEKSSNTEAAASNAAASPAVNTKEKNAALIAQLKADQEKQQQQLQDIVTRTLSKQSNTFGIANNMWHLLAKGKVNVDAATQAQAQKDISEDGYWGVKATSDRIVDFAKALAGNDASKISTLKEAFVKGYKQAEKTWGGKLPAISQQTYDAVFEKFDAWEKEANNANTITIQDNPENKTPDQDADILS